MQIWGANDNKLLIPRHGVDAMGEADLANPWIIAGDGAEYVFHPLRQLARNALKTGPAGAVVNAPGLFTILGNRLLVEDIGQAQLGLVRMTKPATNLPRVKNPYTWLLRR